MTLYQTFRRGPRLVFCALQDARHHAVADEFPDRHRRRRRDPAGHAIARASAASSLIASVVLLAICGFSPLGNCLLYPLEQRFPPWDAGARRAGRHRRARRRDRCRSFGRAWHARSFSSAADRIIAAAALARQYPNARIVFSGGNAESDFERCAGKPITPPPSSKASALPKTRLIMERRSRNTLENAEFSKAIAAPENRRALAVGDLGLSHAAIGRPVSQGRICGRALSGRLAGRRIRAISAILRHSPSTGWSAPTSPCANGSVLSPTGYRARPSELLPGPDPK